MKKSILIHLALASWILNGCGNLNGLLLYDKDTTLQTIQEVHALPLNSSVGFEWKAVTDRRVEGINIYRGLPSNRSINDQGFELIGSTTSRFATHFVDPHVKPNHTYFYTFTTFFKGKESQHGAVIQVKSMPPLVPVSFLEAYRVAPTVVKLLWRPHESERVSAYVIERSEDGQNWEYLAEVEGHLSVEYIDTRVAGHHRYSYRIYALQYDKTRSFVSQPTSISL